MPKPMKEKEMTNIKGSKDGCTWEEISRKDQNLAHNRFSDQQAIKNLTLLKEWCEEKIMILTAKRKRSAGMKEKIENE